jgi:hypothetical protein
MDVYVVLAEDSYGSCRCENKRLHSIYEKEKDAKKCAKELNKKVSLYCDAEVETWNVQ